MSFLLFRCAGVLAVATFVMGAGSGVAQIPAFSGAEGPGATASGGRGGDVYHVTTLDFDKDGVIPGSFRYGVNTAAGPRTIVFDVGGTIYQPGGGSQYWFRSGKSNITVAGQTAPGGITIAGTGTKFTGDNLVVRNLTVRPNQDPVNPSSFTYDGISTQATNSIFDHVTSTWHSDEGISATDAVNNTTVQYALIAEGLNAYGHSFGSIINTENNNAPLAYHHNLYAHNKSRMPRLGSETSTGAVTNFYNNVIYNWGSGENAGYSALNTNTRAEEPSRTNFINNFYAKGVNRGTTIFSSAGPATQIYQSGNLYDGVTDGDFNDAVAVTWGNFSGPETQLASPLAVAGGVIDSAVAGRDRVLAFAGANWWDRNPIDQRIIDSVSAGTGSIPNTVPAGEWADVLAAPLQTRPAGWDTDGDGMPDAWEGAHGLNPGAADNNGDFDADGYTNLEEYLNEIAAWPAPQPIVFSGATNSRYAQITNWDIGWQPSRFDEAQVNAGTVVVDAVGQHAGAVRVATGPGDAATLSVTDGWLLVEDEVTIGGTATSQGVLDVSGGLLRAARLTKSAAGDFQFTGGVLSADEIEFSLINNGGEISPGVGVGQTHVVGDVTMLAGTIALEVAGPNLGEYDRMVIDGHLAAGGTLAVMLDGYAPALGDAFDLLDFGSVTGGWSVALPALSAGLEWDTYQMFTTGVLAVTAASSMNPDFNGDGSVDGLDFLTWQRGLGLTGQTDNSHGDANGDGVVDAADLDGWSELFGQSSPASGAAASVPEPSSWALALGIAALLASAAAAGGRRR
ncbi:MAG: hypothetical protein KDA44_16030 [Planctomycetales bacterium]|nr:hypothetical protein [Planctomycetales bacterium]